TCMGSSTRHIVTFDGLDFKLMGNCSYTLFEDKEEGVEVILHNGACSSAPKVNCMNAIEVTHQGFSLQLYNNMTVTVNGMAVIPPYSNSQVEVNIYGTIMHEVRFLQQNHTLAFTPSNNEFTLQLSPKSFASKMYGLCGVCDQNSRNDLLLKNDSITQDISGFIQDWTIQQPGRICKERKAEVCVERATARCSILLSNLFYECHQIIPPNTFYATCEENNCFGEEVCEIVASYAHLCKVHGVCVDWRTPDFCAMPCPASLIYQPCQKGCTKHCENGTDMQICTDYATEGCFCPPGQVILDGTCVHEDICSQCIGEDGSRHQVRRPLLTPITRAIDCGPCEIPRLQRNSNQCCPVFECVCDLISCKLPPIPHCEDGLQLIQANPGGCRPDYACVCKKEECKPQSTPFCPPHRKPILVKTRCCDEFQCVCSCNNSTVTCPLCEGKHSAEKRDCSYHLMPSQLYFSKQTELNYRMEKTSGSCCGKCLPTRCDIQLRDGTILYLKPNETIQDGCDNHFCKVNQKGDFIWERKITGCPPFDSKKCLAEGGKVTKLGSTCCETCVEPECKLATGRLEFVKVDDCVNENQLNLHYCEGKCPSQAIYNITLNRIEDLCSCCSATAADTMRVPLRCANGSLVHHQVFNARECNCLSRKCQP
ncbi:von Willebrand factor-like, partial [Protobothrops mucrosquamatus]|uniref:von Willebrand factor-like n=1 Tax=Protobothrops mucrosquamatus TaxID=103944 RepID=UPI000775D020